MSKKVVQIQLLGLPGAGKKRLKQALQGYFEGRTGDSEQNFEVLVPEFADVASGQAVLPNNSLNWAVIDCRSLLVVEDAVQQQALVYLEQLLLSCDAVVWMFAESSELSIQSQWYKWLKQWQAEHQRTLPSIQCFAQTFKHPHQGLDQFLQQAPLSHSALPTLPHFQSLHFRLPKVVLEHLLFVLDVSRQNLQRPLWRVKGSVMSAEYVNPVAVEGTVNRWDTYASELSEKDPAMGQLTIEGLGLESDHLQGVLQAAIAQGDWTQTVQVVDKVRKTY